VARPDAELYRQVADLLFDEWDPIGLSALDVPRDEYAGIAARLIRMIQDGADEYKVAKHLSETARVDMGLSHADAGRDRRVARRVIALVRGE
jgi:hypothetical protein